MGHSGNGDLHGGGIDCRLKERGLLEGDLPLLELATVIRKFSLTDVNPTPYIVEAVEKYLHEAWRCGPDAKRLVAMRVLEVLKSVGINPHDLVLRDLHGTSRDVLDVINMLDILTAEIYTVDETYYTTREKIYSMPTELLETADSRHDIPIEIRHSRPSPTPHRVASQHILHVGEGDGEERLWAVLAWGLFIVGAFVALVANRSSYVKHWAYLSISFTVLMIAIAFMLQLISLLPVISTLYTAVAFVYVLAIILTWFGGLIVAFSYRYWKPPVLYQLARKIAEYISI